MYHIQERRGDVQLEIKQRLPESIAREAEALGLLEPESLESLLREGLARRKIDYLFEAVETTSSLVSVTPAKDAEAWEELFRLGDTLAASDTQESGTLTAAVFSMRR